MKLLKFDTGGRPYANDDFDVLQDEVYGAIQATLQGARPMVLSGCSLENISYDAGNNSFTADIAPGMVWLAGGIHHYDGALAVLLPVEIAAGGYIDSDYRPYQTGGSKPCMYERDLITQASGTAPAGTAVLFGYSGPGLTYWKYIESRTRAIGEVQWLTKYATEQYDQSGKGHFDQGAAGWALCNGQNGTANLAEKFIVAMNPASAEYGVGKTGGAATVTLTTAQIPAHAHTMDEAGDHAHNYSDSYNQSKTDAVDPGNATRATEPTSSTRTTTRAGAHVHIINTAGGGQAHENRPPYYALIAREWIGL